MEKRGKNFLVTTEKHEITVIRSGREDQFREYCPQCGAETDFLNFDVASRLSGWTGRALVGEIAHGGVHSIETPAGYLKLCARSLEAEKRNANKDHD